MRSSVSSWSTTPVSVWPISSCSSRAIRRRSSSCASSARRRAVAPLALEPVEHVVERHAELGHLGHGTSSSTRWPGASGSTRRISAVRRSSGPNTRRISTRFDGQDDRDAEREHDHLAELDLLELTVAGETASTTTAATSTAALIATTRQNSDTRTMMPQRVAG